MQMTMRVLIRLGVLFSLATLIAAQGPKARSPGAAEIASTKAYVKQIDRFIKLNPKSKRTFADVGNAQENWREFKSKLAKGETNPEDLNEIGHAWAREGKVVAAGLAFQSESRDWAHFVRYYFREDGTLAKIYSRLNTFYGNVTAIREQYYSRNGRLLKTTARYLDIETQKPKKSHDFQDHPTPVYLNVRKLPFSKLL